jgi:hypothetical protein
MNTAQSLARLSGQCQFCQIPVLNFLILYGEVYLTSKEKITQYVDNNYGMFCPTCKNNICVSCLLAQNREAEPRDPKIAAIVRQIDTAEEDLKFLNAYIVTRCPSCNPGKSTPLRETAGDVLTDSQPLIKPIPEGRKDMDKQELMQMYVDFLQSEGYRPEISEESGLVRFKSEGKNYFIMIDFNDHEFFKLIFPNFFPFNNEKEQRKVMRAIDYANERTKVIKMHTLENNVWATFEMFCYPPEQFKKVWSRALDAISTAVNFFREKYNS